MIEYGVGGIFIAPPIIEFPLGHNFPVAVVVDEVVVGYHVERRGLARLERQHLVIEVRLRQSVVETGLVSSCAHSVNEVHLFVTQSLHLFYSYSVYEYGLYYGCTCTCSC